MESTIENLLLERNHLEFKIYQCKVNNSFFDMEKYQFELEKINEQINEFQFGSQQNLPITRIMRWWKNQSFENDKGGTFNLIHYLKLSEIKSTATIHKLCRHNDSI